MKDDQLINKKFHILQRKKILHDSERFIYNEVGSRITDNLEGINLSINKCLEIGLASNNICKYLFKRNKNINYDALDLSQDLLTSLPNLRKNIKKYCADHDKWNIAKDEYNLILSNFYIHLTNNLEKLLKNIYISLKDNGFFIASIPGSNFFTELKEVMLYTDLKLYGGVYKRFIDSFSIQIINKLMKNNNFKDTLIEIDLIKLQYDNFEKLINDVKNMGNSYIFNDRKKKLENKKYFQIAEEIYWEKFSINKKIRLTLEIVYFSGWKSV